MKKDKYDMKRFVLLTSMIFVFGTFMSTTAIAKKSDSNRETRRVCVTTINQTQKCRNFKIHQMRKGTKVPKRGNR
jgi:hypothetical protein